MASLSPYLHPRPRRSLLVRLVPVAVAAALLVVGAGMLREWLPSLPNPFASHTVDRSQPALLKSLVDLQQFRASSANLQSIVDIEKDYDWTPSWVRGERTLFVAAGSVDATVDFSRLDSGAIALASDRHSVTVTLPHAVLGQVHLDVRHSYVASRHRGVLDRAGSVVGQPTSDSHLYAAAERKLATAAAADPDIIRRAEANTAATIRRMVTALGFEHVDVRFASAG